MSAHLTSEQAEDYLRELAELGRKHGVEIEPTDIDPDAGFSIVPLPETHRDWVYAGARDFYADGVSHYYLRLGVP